MTWQFNEDDKEKLVCAFESLVVKSDMEDPEALKAWMVQFVKGQDDNNNSLFFHRVTQLLTI